MDTTHAPRTMRIKAIACEVLARQVYLAAARSPHAVDVEMLEKGLHDDSASLREELQRRIDAVDAARYDAAVLVYGLCNRATEGLVARHVPLALARAHDCITLYLGSRARYAAEFEAQPGTYYYSAEWLERAPGSAAAPAGAPDAPDSQDAGGEGMAYGSRMPSKYEELVRQYGEDNAKYLMEIYGGWRQHYTRAAYITQPCTRCEVAVCGHDARFRDRARTVAERNGWEFAALEGNPGLVARLIDGEWEAGPTGDDDDIVVIPTGQSILATFDERVVAAAPATP